MHQRNRGLLARLATVLICTALVAVIALIVLLSLSPSEKGDSGPSETGSPVSETADMAARDVVPASASASESAPPDTQSPEPSKSPEPSVSSEPSPEPSPEPEPESDPEPPPRRGYFEEIPPEVRESMAGISMPDGATVTYDDLRYLTVYHYDFEGNHTAGNIVVAAELADEVLDIFAELYDIEYPMECVRLIDEFYYKQTPELDSLDRASMGNNNTSSFCYRAMNSAGTLSQHAFGRAIDLNPKVNPYVSGGSISPANAKIYADRSGEGLPEVEQRAIIRKDDEVYKIFTSRGWRWGCEIWNGVYDYQHFQKPAS